MTSGEAERLADIHRQLFTLAMDWAGRKAIDADRARELRQEAILLNHRHYLDNIPAYQKLAQVSGVGDIRDIDLIKKELMSTDDIFKSYSQDWLDKNDFSRMNNWLGSIYHQRIDVPVEGVKRIDEWIKRLSAKGIFPVFSSGTTGAFSFVPRNARNWDLLTLYPISYLTPHLIDKKAGSVWLRWAAVLLSRVLPLDSFLRAVKAVGLRHYDGILLGFRRGNMGIQIVGQIASTLVRRPYFLFETEVKPDAIRLISRGPKTEEDHKLLRAFRDETIGRKEENYQRIISQMVNSTRQGQRVLLFGAPFQVKELCDMVSHGPKHLSLRKGSSVLFGGGWKTFAGERIEREALISMISETFQVPPGLIIEGYSMTEINAVLIRCDKGRFHLPPFMEPVIFNEELLPVKGKDVRGAFGFLDPFAVSYPGFIISGDNVRMVDGECACGLSAPAILEVARAPGREVKGCGGIMASVQA